jgi:hypothetical protein
MENEHGDPQDAKSVESLLTETLDAVRALHPAYAVHVEIVCDEGGPSQLSLSTCGTLVCRVNGSTLREVFEGAHRDMTGRCRAIWQRVDPVVRKIEEQRT